MKSFLKSSFGISLLILLFGMLCQGLMLTSTRGEVLDLPLIDEATYHRQAVQLSSDHPQAPNRPYWQPPFYMHVLAWVYGEPESADPINGRRAQILLTGLTALFTFLCGRSFMSQRAAAIAALLVCLYGPLLFFNSRLLPTGLAACLNMMMLWLLTRAADKPSLLRWLLAGLGLGLAAITVPNVLVMLLIIAAWLIIKVRPETDNKQALRLSLAAATGILICIIPVLVHNIKASGEWVPISTNGGINLYIGNNTNTTATINARPGTTEWKALTALPHHDEILKDSQADRWYKKKVAAYAVRHPGSFIAGLFSKSLQLINGHEAPRNLDIYTLRDQSWLLKISTWKIDSFGFPASLIFPLAFVGIMVRFKQRDLSHLVMGYLILYALSIILFFPAARYRVPLMPAALLFAVMGAQWLWTERKQAKTLMYKYRAGALLVLLILCSLPLTLPGDKLNYKAELYNAAGAGFEVRGRHNKALQYFTKALDNDPDYAEACYNIGLVYQGLGDMFEALDWQAEALKRNPDHAGAHNSLGIIYYRQKSLIDAGESFTRAVQIDPLNFRAWNNLGLIYASENKMDKALGAFSSAAHIQSNFYEAYMNIAMIYDHQNKKQEALDMCRYVLSRQPGNSSAQTLQMKLLAEIESAPVTPASE